MTDFGRPQFNIGRTSQHLQPIPQNPNNRCGMPRFSRQGKSGRNVAREARNA